MPRDVTLIEENNKSSLLEYDTIIFSDTHLGNEETYASYLLEFLLHVSAKNIIINGDFIDFWDLSLKQTWKFSETELRVLDQINKMKRNGVNITFVTGNHEEDEFRNKRFLGKTVRGIHFTDRVRLFCDEGEIDITHGDEFDLKTQKNGRFYHSLVTVTKTKHLYHKFWKAYNNLAKNVREAGVAEKLPSLPQWMNPRYSLAKAIGGQAAVENQDRQDTVLAHHVHAHALRAAKKRRVRYKIIGHTHTPGVMESTLENGDKCTLIDGGDWSENTKFIGIKHAGAAPELYDWRDERLKLGLSGHPDHSRYQKSFVDRAESLRIQVGCYYLCSGKARSKLRLSATDHFNKAQERLERADNYRGIADVIRRAEALRRDIRKDLSKEFSKINEKYKRHTAVVNELVQSKEGSDSDADAGAALARHTEKAKGHKEVLLALDAALHGKVTENVGRIVATFERKAEALELKSFSALDKMRKAQKTMRENRPSGARTAGLQQDVQELEIAA